jgi:ankyrin repeat protein
LFEKWECKESKCSKGYTALIAAAFYGKDATVKMLIQMGADKEATTNIGSTVLIAAAIRG